MNSSRLTSALAFGVLLLSLGSACGEDEEPGGSAGTAGEGGSGGSAGKGGTGGTGGLRDASADAPKDGGLPRATATLESRSDSTATGTAVFEQVGNTVTLTLTVQGAPPGKHGVHIHQGGNCGAADGGATEAGGHWNPTDASHGSPDAASHHLGDVGNIDITDGGSATLTFSTNAWSIGTGNDNDVVGHAIVVHSIEDGLQPDSALGARISCGVIRAGANSGG
jgi:superoxide dismutase, Cu-Zn family